MQSSVGFRAAYGVQGLTVLVIGLLMHTQIVFRYHMGPTWVAISIKVSSPEGAPTGAQPAGDVCPPPQVGVAIR